MWLFPAKVYPRVVRLFSGSLEKSKLAWGICKCLWHCFQSHLNSLGSFFAWSMFSKATIDKHDLALPLSFIIVGKLPLTPPCPKNCFYRVSHQSFLLENVQNSTSAVPCLLRSLNPLSFIIAGKLPLTPPCSKNCFYRVSHLNFHHVNV